MILMVRRGENVLLSNKLNRGQIGLFWNVFKVAVLTIRTVLGDFSVQLDPHV